MLRTFVGLLTLLPPLAAAAEQRVTEAEAGRTVPLKVGETLEVRLPAQFGTGFSWAPVAPPALLTPQGQRTEPAGPAMPGGTELQVFPFVAARPGEAALRFAYRQPWQPDQAARRFEVTVRVTPQ